jgi:D-methionine transport system ATP-binding protein
LTEQTIVTHDPRPPHIQLSGISKAYPNGVQALQDIDLTLRQGEIFGIIGRSGAGKSTLLRLFNRLENADSGEMFIHGEQTLRYFTQPAARPAPPGGDDLSAL